MYKVHDLFVHPRWQAFAFYSFLDNGNVTIHNNSQRLTSLVFTMHRRAEQYTEKRYEYQRRIIETHRHQGGSQLWHWAADENPQDKSWCTARTSRKVKSRTVQQVQKAAQTYELYPCGKGWWSRRYSNLPPKVIIYIYCTYTLLHAFILFYHYQN